MRTVLLLLVLVLSVTGCRSHYQITLNNGNRITTLGKPKYDNGWYVYRDLNGRTNYISETRIQVIEPQPRGYTDDALFNPARKK